MRLFRKPFPCLKQVLVTLKTDKTFRGLLWERQGPYLVLRQAALLKGRGETVPVDGELVIDAGNVDFFQVVG